MNAATLRKNTIETLGLLVERYPNLRIGQILNGAGAPFEMYLMPDEDLARGLNQLFVAYTQLEAAGIKP